MEILWRRRLLKYFGTVALWLLALAFSAIVVYVAAETALLTVYGTITEGELIRREAYFTPNGGGTNIVIGYRVGEETLTTKGSSPFSAGKIKFPVMVAYLPSSPQVAMPWTADELFTRIVVVLFYISAAVPPAVGRLASLGRSLFLRMSRSKAAAQGGPAR
jgi:hypothetical protein